MRASESYLTELMPSTDALASYFGPIVTGAAF